MEELNQNDKWDEVSVEHTAPELIPEGEYVVKVVRFEMNDKFMGRKKLYLYADIIEGDCSGVELFVAINMDYRKFGPSSKFYLSWLVANGGVPPKRADRMSARVFKDAIFKASVRSCGMDGVPAYSIISHLIERIYPS